ncbi:hypothetical protein NCLIV_034920 [Neospora caninum Liverpool]|uniref:Uncharacterized protein n=1 Tax=Neospora caninum (strain Liverpool) TaxID=572307 RepID=F0VJ00_NEOCL|nr:hypothetical protein NCLIV_034920 [Neospora caninum Liverpool]CBZ53711.1 hypothetical protein NCLIV_034920 [Neospora caninum Liverpool]|eukprot:XP_003883743.1 hypothetical protein NCLIV_034920 [Neospora caninum Liverpool]
MEESVALIGIMCLLQNQAIALVEHLLPLGVGVHVFVREPRDEASAGVRTLDPGASASLSSLAASRFSGLPSGLPHRQNLQVHQVGTAFPDILSATADLGVDALLLLPGCESANRPSPKEDWDKRTGFPSSQRLDRSLLSAGLACLAVGGRIVTGCDICQPTSSAVSLKDASGARHMLG